MAVDVTPILQKLAATDQSLFLAVLQWAEKFNQLQQGPTAFPLTGGQAPTDDAAAGRDYTLTPSAIRDEDKAALRQGLADGIALDRLVTYVQGLLTGATLAGGGL